MSLRSLSALLPLGVAALACTSSTTTTPALTCGPNGVATTNWDVVAVTDYEAAWYWAAADPIPPSLYTFALGGMATAPPQVVNAASAVAAAVSTYYPNGCATATATANVVTFVLNNCSGPLGLVNSSGMITATFSATGNGQIQIQLAGSRVTANGATLDLATTGTVSVGANGQKTLTVSSMSSGTGAYGNSVAHVGMYTLVWPTGTNCGTINGTLSGVGTGGYSGTTTQINNYVACAGACPQSGSATSSFNGGTVMLTFNGSNNAQCTASNGTSAGIALHCP
jgi:hypothetical protein